MRIAALLGATVLAFSAAPALAFDLDDLNPFTPDYHDVHAYHAGHAHYHHVRHTRAPRGYAMVAPGVMHTPYGMFLYDDTLGEWEHWKD